MSEPKKPASDMLPMKKESWLFGVDLRRAFPLPDNQEFDDLLRAIDQLDSDQTG
jgi:hypothetical protein